MSKRLPGLLGIAILGAFTAAGCTDQPLTGVPAPEDGARAATVEMCEVIDFDQFRHGDAVTSVSLPTLGLTLNVSTMRFADPGGGSAGAVSARAFETDGLNDNPFGPGSVVVEDDDLQWRGEDNPFGGETDDGGECAGCEGLGRLLVIPDDRPFVPWGDAVWGGTITFSGNFSGGSYYLQSFIAVDIDASSPGVRLLVDGTQVAQSANLGNGSVQTVAVGTPHTIGSSFSFQLGTEVADTRTGSGAIDGIRICSLQNTGGEGCTLGYWKQQHHFDSWVATGFAPAQTLESVFDVPDTFGLDNVSLASALEFKGGSDATAAARLLLKQAVAALLNAAHPDVDYELTTAQVIAQVNAALDTRSRSTMLALASQLDGFNNAGCPLN
ncbi:MAG TPA: hypothetical protein VGR37_13475 [Longimicrobiaceae bacterium]|nr:hypothetical protein [Longimicrobiaceae bacterium]